MKHPSKVQEEQEGMNRDLMQKNAEEDRKLIRENATTANRTAWAAIIVAFINVVIMGFTLVLNWKMYSNTLILNRNQRFIFNFKLIQRLNRWVWIRLKNECWVPRACFKPVS